MTQLHLIEQAKQGDPGAIAELMNKSLHPKGMTAAVERYGDRLEVMLEAERVPNRQALTAFVEKGISNLGIQVIRSVKVSGREIGAPLSSWTEELHLAQEISTPEFEPEAPVDPLMVDGLDSDRGMNLASTESDFHQDFNMDAIAETVQDEQRLDELTQLTDLSQLQDLLSEESEQPISERQRQLLEEQIETIWQEQSAQADNFLADLMSSDPSQFSGAEEMNQDWMAALEHETEEPNEILPDFMEHHAQVSGLNEQALPGDEDEPDEVLPGFLPRSSLEASTNEFGEGASQFDFAPDDNENVLEGLPSEEDIVKLFEETAEPISEATPPPVMEESITFLRDLPEKELTAEPYEMKVDPPAQDVSFLDEAQTAIAVPGEMQPEPEAQALELDEFSSESASSNEFGADEFRNESSELSFDDVSQTHDVSLTFDDSSDHSGSLTDSPSELWNQPPIEFLQDEPVLSLPEMPTERLDEPFTEFTMEPSDTPEASTQLGNTPEGFPQGFLEDSQEPLGDLSEEFNVDPNENPFIEQMEENRDRPDAFPADTPKPSDEDFETFNQSEWQFSEDESNVSESANPTESDDFDFSGLSSDLSDLSLEPLESYDPTPAPESSEAGTSSPMDELSDEALASFFATDSPESSSEPINPNLQLDQEFQFDQFDEYDQPNEFGGQINHEFEQSSEFQLSDENVQSGEYELSEDFGLGEPFATSSSSLPTQPPMFPEEDMPESEYPPTEIPGSQLADTQIPVRQELSQEALEEQVAAYEFDPPPNDQSLDRTVDRDDRMVPVDSDGEATGETRNSPWLFPLIFLGISGWIVGLISFAFLWSRLSSPPPLLGQNGSPDTTDVAADDPAGAVTDCPPPEAGGTPVALSNLQFQPNSANPQQVNLIGCVTNQTEQAIDIVSVAYRSNAGAATIGGLDIPDNLVQPGQTVAFTSRFTVPSDVSNVAIDTVFWQPAGGSTSEEAATSIQVNR